MNISVRLRPHSALRLSALYPRRFSRISRKTRVASVLLNNTRMRIARSSRSPARRSRLVFTSPAAAQVPPPAPSTQKPPTAFANVDLPTWMRIGVEYRGRLEGFTGGGFADDREDLYWLNRFRVTARFSMKPWLSAAVQAQDARVEGRNGSHHRRPVPRSVRPATRACGRRHVREEPVRAARGTAGAGVRRPAARRTRQLAQHRALVRCRARRLPPQEAARRRLRRLRCRHRHG